MKRRWVVTALSAILIVGGFFWLGRGRQNRSSSQPSRLLPLASELEGIRGVYLYFGIPGADSLAAEYRDVVVKDRPADQVRAIYRELVAGPSENHVALFPEGTELVNAYLTPRGTLYLDWNRTLVQGFRGGSGRERLLLGSIVRTAAENLPEVEQVAILVDGNPIETIGGHYDVLAPLAVSEWR